jgi:hypothetical protein
VINESTADLDSKPTLPVSLHTQTYLVLSQILFALCHSSDYKISEDDKRNIQEFVSKQFPHTTLDLLRLTKEMVIDFCGQVADKIRSSQANLTSPAVSPSSRIYYPIEDDQPFNPDAYGYKVDTSKLALLRLAFTQAKLGWSIGSSNPSKFIELYLEGTQIWIASIAEALNMTPMNRGIASELLTRMADHVSKDTMSPSLVYGYLDYHQYALAADMLGFALAYPDITALSQKLRVPQSQMLPVREGLMQASRTLLLMYLNLCEDCFFKLHTSNTCFEKHSQGEEVVIPCPHGFILSHI